MHPLSHRPSAAARLLALSLPLSLALSGCIIVVGDGYDDWYADALVGSGVRDTRELEVEPFTGIEISDGIDLDVRVGPPAHVEVTGDDNLLAYVRTRVQDGVLRIELEDGSYRPDEGLRASVSVPELESIAIEGASDVNAEGVQGERFAISISGAGDVVIEGEVDRLEASISGSGDMDLARLKARTATLSISGSGDIAAAVSEELQATISGSGDISYRGDPRASVSISGSGAVHRE